MPRLRVAYLGPRHSFTHIAATRLFPDAEYVAAKSITEVFNLVESYEASYGVVPLENSLEGPRRRDPRQPSINNAEHIRWARDAHKTSTSHWLREPSQEALLSPPRLWGSIPQRSKDTE